MGIKKTANAMAMESWYTQTTINMRECLERINLTDKGLLSIRMEWSTRVFLKEVWKLTRGSTPINMEKVAIE